MRSLLKKELNTFFGSVIAYLVVTIFLLVTSLFLWVFPGAYNVLEGQQAGLEGLFRLAPWLYLFLIPAISMRMFAEEKRMGTIEMIYTRPISTFGVVLSKYLAALILVLVSLLPTLLYFYSVYQLGNPVGNIDTGATWGSYMGLLLLASVYVSIGLFASTFSSNQIVAFLLAILFCFSFYTGFDFAASLFPTGSLEYFLRKTGIEFHFASISRGIIDSRDLIYFLSITALFLFFTYLRERRASYFKTGRMRKILIFTVLLIASAILTTQRIFRIDMTAEKRYSLTELSKDILAEQKTPLRIEVYLAGDLPAGMRDFQEAIIEKIEDLAAYSDSRIIYEVVDVYSITKPKEREQFINELVQAGIQPVNFGHKTTEGLSTRQILPGLIVQGTNRWTALNLLKNNPLLNSDEDFKQSTELLEYELIRAIRNLQQNEKPVVAFLDKQGCANQYETADLRFALKEKFDIVDLEPKMLKTADSVDILLVADPKEVFSEEEKIQIDQFLMQGNSILWCIDPVSVSIDSLSKGYSTLAFEKGLNLRDQLFRYGVRLNPDLLQDAFCREYPVNTAPPGQPTNFTPAPFYYSPLALPNPNHPLSRNLNNVMLEFCSSVDALQNNNMEVTPILATSPYARSIQTPVRVSLLSATNPPDQRLFNTPNIPIGVLLDGRFSSVFTNRLTAKLGFDKIKEQSDQTRMIVIADGDIIKNQVRYRNGQPEISPLGYDQYSGQTFGNLDFLVNCVHYLADEDGLMNMRSKVVKLRLLNKVKIRDEANKWKAINTILPLLVFMLFGIVFQFIRKKRFRKEQTQ